MKKDRTNLLYTLLSVLISVVIYGGVWTVGFFCVPKSPFFGYAAIALGALSVSVAILNVILYHLQSHKINGFTVKQADDYINAKKTVIENDYAKAENKIDRGIRLTFIYSAFLIVLFLSMVFATAVADLPLSDDDGGASVLLAVAAAFLMQGVIRFLIFNRKIIEENNPNELPRDSFPLLYGLVEECAALAESEKRVRLFFTSGGICISQGKKQTYLMLNPVEVALMTKNELKAVMLHEFAHERNEDIRRRIRHDGFEEKPHGGAGEFLFLSTAIAFVGLQIDVYREVASRVHESRADEYVVQCGMAQDYVNATAKAVLFYIYGGYEWKETSFDTYADEVPVNDYLHRELANFKRRLIEYKDRWFFTLDNELPQRIDSHPTFKMRREACGISSYDAETVETDEKYIAESDAFLKFADAKFYERYNAEDYARIRRESYVYRTELFKKAEAEGESFAFASDNEQIELAQAYIGVDNAKSLSILRQVMSRSDNTLAYFLAGMILSWEYDDECISMFKKAAENSAFFEEASDRLAKYALKTGNAELIKEYRETIVEKTQAIIDDEALTDLNRIAVLDKPNVGSTEHEIVNELKQYWGNALVAVYLAEYVGENGITAKYYAVELKKSADVDYMKSKTLSDDLFFRMTDSATRYYVFYGGKYFLRVKAVKDSEIYSASKAE